MKLMKCMHCGNVVEVVKNSGVPIVCCGENMHELVANTTDGAKEKHVPVAELDGNVLHVEVGSILHPMTTEHLIVAIFVENGSKVMRANLDETMPPMADFLVDPELGITVYEYCNLHGLWKVDVK